MDEDYRNAVRLVQLELTAGRAALQLAKVASAFDALIETGRMLEGTSVPDVELATVPDVDELLGKEEDMPLGEAAQILIDFFELGVEGQARLHLILGLEIEE